MTKPSQETIALAGLIVTSNNGIRAEIQAVRDEARADREALRAEARANREAFQEEFRVLRAETRADRESFEKHIGRVSREQGRLTGIVEQMRTASR